MFQRIEENSIGHLKQRREPPMTDNTSTHLSITAIFSVIASAIGLILAIFGLWALGGAIYVVWELFQDPDSISYFARYVSETTRLSTYLENGSKGPAHLIAWFVVILLLLVLGKLGDWAISTGVRLLNLRHGQ